MIFLKFSKFSQKYSLNLGCEMKSRDTARTCSAAACLAVNPDE